MIGAVVGAAVGAGLGYLADKIAAASNALVATESIASLGGGVLSTASADGDPTNEIKTVGETLYHLTNYETAQKIKETGQLIGSKFESGVCAWKEYPTLEQAANSGAHYFDYIIKFQTNYSGWAHDTGLQDKLSLYNIAVRSSSQVVEIYNVVISKFR